MIYLFFFNDAVISALLNQQSSAENITYTQSSKREEITLTRCAIVVG